MKKLTIVLFSVAGVFLTGCLKERPINTDPANHGVSNIIEFANTGDNAAAATSTYPRFNTVFDQPAPGESVKFNINLNYAGVDVAPTDITLQLAVDPDLLATFNAENGTSYEVPPADVFSFPTSVVIKKGTSMAQLQASVTATSNYDYSASYAIPIKIVSASSGTVSANFGKAVYSFIIKNEWHGKYGIQGEISGNNGYAGTVIDATKNLSTISANGVSEGDIAAFFGGYTEYFFNPDGTIGVEAYNAAGGSSYGASVIESSYDASTHNFHVKFSILSGNYVFDLTYTRK